jgi:hypothetical protein
MPESLQGRFEAGREMYGCLVPVTGSVTMILVTQATLQGTDLSRSVNLHFSSILLDDGLGVRSRSRNLQSPAWENISDSKSSSSDSDGT